MDYEKKYNERLDSARYWRDVSEGDIPAVLEEIFPELRESEDEKIRKVLLDYFKDYKTQEEISKSLSTFFGIPTDNILAWLEKQGRKPIEWKQENREELTEFENAMMHIGGSFFGENAGLDPNDTATIKEQANLLVELAAKTGWDESDDEEFEIAIDTLKGAGQYDSAAWLITLKQRIGG